MQNAPLESVPKGSCVEHLVPSRWCYCRSVHPVGDRAGPDQVRGVRGVAQFLGSLPFISPNLALLQEDSPPQVSQEPEHQSPPDTPRSYSRVS